MTNFKGKITVIGSGSAFAQKYRQTCLFIETGKTHLLVDFGMTGPQAWAATFPSRPLASSVMNIFPTHSHADHVGGLEYLALMNRYISRPAGRPKLNMLITEEYQRVLWENTLRGGLEYNATEGAEQRKLMFSDYFETLRPKWKTHQPREIWTFQLEDLSLEIFRTKHIPDSANGWSDSFISYGLCIDDACLYTGDTRFDPELLEIYGDRVSLILHDCQSFTGGVHASLEELESLPESLRCKIFGIHHGDKIPKESGIAGFVEDGTCFRFPKSQER